METTKDFIKDVFNGMVKRYEVILKKYYPAFGSNGFTERNLTFNFCNSYLELSSDYKDDVIIWQEVPIKIPDTKKSNNHIDSLIIDNERKLLIFIEAKRIRNERTYQSLEDDIKRIKDNYQNIPGIDNDTILKKYGVFLTDIWTPKVKKGKRGVLKEKMKDDFKRKCTLVYNPQEKEYEDYYMNYKVIELK